MSVAGKCAYRQNGLSRYDSLQSSIHVKLCLLGMLLLFTRAIEHWFHHIAYHPPQCHVTWTSTLITQNVVLTSFQHHLTVMDVRWTLKQCCVLTVKGTFLDRDFSLDQLQFTIRTFTSFKKKEEETIYKNIRFDKPKSNRTQPRT